MSKKLQYSNVIRNIIIYEHNSLLKKTPIVFCLLLKSTRYEIGTSKYD
jgi:hypothetical protein